MSSSSKGQSIIKKQEDVVEKACYYALKGSRGDLQEVIIEGFIAFESEITLLTVTQHNGETLYCELGISMKVVIIAKAGNPHIYNQTFLPKLRKWLMK